jgi:ATP synthase protein I
MRAAWTINGETIRSLAGECGPAGQPRGVLAGGRQLGALSMRPAKNLAGGAGTALVLLLRAEAIKIIAIAVLLLLIFKLYASNLVPAALIAGLAVAALLSGIGIMRVNEKE